VRALHEEAEQLGVSLKRTTPSAEIEAYVMAEECQTKCEQDDVFWSESLKNAKLTLEKTLKPFTRKASRQRKSRSAHIAGPCRD
jgi:hypothetical protein